MNANSYLAGIIKKYSITEEERSRLQAKAKPLYREIHKWGNKHIVEIIQSGSLRKGTAVRGSKVDIDLFISLKNNTPCSLEQIYESLYNSLDNSYFPRKQNVSIGIIYKGIKVDLVPAKKQPNMQYPHSIYVSKRDTWTKTNINTHINIVKQSPHRGIIKLFKVWRTLHKIDFPSFLLELTIIEALKRRAGLELQRRCLTVLEYIINDFEHARVLDPANSNNVISDSITNDEKRIIVNAGLSAYRSGCWEKTVWGLYEIEK